MAGNRISGLYLALFFGTVAFIGITMLQTDLFQHYGVAVPPELSYLNMNDSLIGQGENVTNLVTPKSITGIAPLDTLISGIYNSLNILFGIGNLYTTFAGNVLQLLNIPSVFLPLIVFGIMIAIAFSIISVITNRDV